MKLSLSIIIALFSTQLLAQEPVYEELLNSVQKAYAENDFATAYPLFEQLFDQMPESTEINFYLGRCALELQRYDEAVAAFDRVLMLNPNHTQTHLELARLYYERKELELAKIELDLVLNDQLPNDVRDFVTTFQRKIDESISPHRFSGAIIVGGGYDSNVNNDIGATQFTIPTLDFPLSGNEKKGDGYSFSTFVLNHSYDFGDRGSWSLENSFVVYDKLYSQSSLNNLVLFSLSLSPTWSGDKTTVALPVTFDRVYIDGKGYLANVGAGIKSSYLLDPLSQIEGGYSFKKGSYHEETYDVKAHLLFANYRRIIGENLFALGLHASYGINKEIESVRTDVQNKEWKYGFDFSKEFTKDFRSSLGYTRILTKYDDVDDLFLTKRQDAKDQYELSFGYTLQKNLSLSASVMYSNNRSNHDPFGYDKINALASIIWTL